MFELGPESYINYNSPTMQNIMGFNQYTGQQMPVGNQGYNDYGGNPYLQYMNNGYIQPANNLNYYPQQNPYMYNQQQQMNYYPQNNQMNPYMNGGYYSGYYNYDPQAILRQMEEQKKAEEEALKNQISIKIMKQKIYDSFYGIETDEEYLEKYFNPNTYAELQKDIDDYAEMAKLSEISNNPMNIIGVNARYVNEMNKISQEIRSKHPVDQSFIEFMETAGDLYRDALINDHVRELRKNIANTYDGEAFRQLAAMNRNPYTSLRQKVSVDDLSISLPDHLIRSDDYQKRRNDFLNYITRNDIRNQGGGRNG